MGLRLKSTIDEGIEFDREALLGKAKNFDKGYFRTPRIMGSSSSSSDSESSSSTIAVVVVKGGADDRVRSGTIESVRCCRNEWTSASVER